MSHTTKSTPFLGARSSYHEHRLQRLESISLRTGRSVLRADIGNEWNTPDSHIWRSQSDLKKQLKYGELQTLHTMLHSSLGGLQLSPVLAVLIKEDEGITLRTALARVCSRTPMLIGRQCKGPNSPSPSLNAFAGPKPSLLLRGTRFRSEECYSVTTTPPPSQTVSSECSRLRPRRHGGASG